MLARAGTLMRVVYSQVNKCGLFRSCSHVVPRLYYWSGHSSSKLNCEINCWTVSRARRTDAHCLSENTAEYRSRARIPRRRLRHRHPRQDHHENVGVSFSLPQE